MAAIVVSAILGGVFGGIKAAQNGCDILTGVLYGAGIGALGALLLPAATSGIGAFAVGFGFLTDIGEQMIVEKKDFEDVNLADSFNSGITSGIFNMFSAGIENSVLRPFRESGDLLGSNMSNIIYSTNFEIGSFTVGQITSVIGVKERFTIRDLKYILNPKKYPGMLR